MKNIIRLSVVIGFLLLQGCTPSAKSSSITSSEPPITNSPGGSDKYEIRWTGTGGKKLSAGYSVVSKDFATPMRVESVNGTLPHKISFSAPKNSVVSASAITTNKEVVEIKIYKNGSECGKVGIVGSGASANKVCS
ncbi:hypothetical protein [Nostoc sp. FACHB-110]|uniref:hypothetical protein n=1 Tax=Nostoc sp. FACHB-110 TaxID=2692834 RepID=UPI001686281C|nr:hypothetical protein [Nostoc sp. FACHB-110]MBD2435832.1 hypothetical protein [Nostoc sp. FACHB-110]